MVVPRQLDKCVPPRQRPATVAPASRGTLRCAPFAACPEKPSRRPMSLLVFVARTRARSHARAPAAGRPAGTTRSALRTRTCGPPSPPTTTTR
eukprot:4650351-Prymnesium_polylepis.1